jgi:hypothetical protein
MKYIKNISLSNNELGTITYCHVHWSDGTSTSQPINGLELQNLVFMSDYLKLEGEIKNLTQRPLQLELDKLRNEFEAFKIKVREVCGEK